VLATAVIPRADNQQVAEIFGLDVDSDGFFQPLNDEMDPVISPVPGIFMAGTGLGPKDIPETVAQASGAAAKVLGVLQRSQLEQKLAEAGSYE
jgi:heterodisulfide reductase subunit A2